MKQRFIIKGRWLRVLALVLIICLATTMLVGCKKKAQEPIPEEVEEPVTEVTEPESESEPASESEAKPEGEPEPESKPEPEPEPVAEQETPEDAVIEEPEEAELIAEDGWYYSKEDVALYIYTYGHLPDNYITKNEAKKLGWTGGSVEKYAEGRAIGGDKFGNYEGNLPSKKGRTYWECDIDTNGGKKRGAKRIIFSSDGLIYYTDDHYETFELLYGEEDA